MRIRASRAIGIACAAARRRVLDRMSYVGLALLVTAAPCLLIAMGLLFAR